MAQIEKANPAFNERHVESSRPCELLSQDTFFVGTIKGVEKRKRLGKPVNGEKVSNTPVE